MPPGISCYRFSWVIVPAEARGSVLQIQPLGTASVSRKEYAELAIQTALGKIAKGPIAAFGAFSDLIHPLSNLCASAPLREAIFQVGIESKHPFEKRNCRFQIQPKSDQMSSRSWRILLKIS
jgi:hypothetical protein